jgi:hypothetical protein
MMSPDRLEELLSSYGGSEDRWPEELRASMRAGLESGSEIRQALDSAQRLDALLDAYVPALPNLEQRILEAVPKTRLEKLLDWLLPTLPHLWWRPALACAMPLIIGVAIGLSGLELPLLATAASTDWETAERTLIAPLDWYEQTGAL